MAVIGQDISFYQGSVDFSKMKNAGTEFVIIRAGQNTWIDTQVTNNMTGAKTAGIPRGTYWFYDSRAEPKSQARLYINALKGDLGELPLFADLEEKYGGRYGGWHNWYIFLEELRRLAGTHEIGIYTAPYYWKENMAGVSKANQDYFKRYPLWIANYGVNSPMVPYPWGGGDWVFWQYTDKGDGTLYGVDTLSVDMNYFNGDTNAFNKRFNLAGEAPLPPGEVYPTEVEVLMSDGSKQRYKLTKA